MKFSWKLLLIVIAIVIAVVLMFVFGFQGVQNTAISYMGDLVDRLVECNPNIGFGLTELCKAQRLHEKFENERMCGS